MKILVSKSAVPIVILIVTCCTTRCIGGDDIPVGDPILGQWTVKKATRDGKDRDNAIGYVYIFRADGRFTLLRPDGTKRMDGRFEIEGQGDARDVLIESEEDRHSVGGGGPRLGIFKTYHNRRMKLQLQICINIIGSASGHARPDSFDAPEGEYRELITLELDD